MHANTMTTDVQAIEKLMEMSASVVAKLNSLVQIEAPVKPLAMSSDCCGSNNYDQK